MREHGHLRDYDFLQAVIFDHLGCSVSVEGKENIPEEDRLLFVSNHPLGGLDGMILTLLLHNHRSGHDLRVIVNDLLMNLHPVASLFVPVNKVGIQKRDYALQQQQMWQSDTDILSFPAGLCSRLQHGQILDLPWQKAFVRNAVRYKRSIVPIYFDGHNSMHFYRIARWRKRLHIHTNIEMLYLADEMYRQRGQHMRLIIGQPIPYTSLTNEYTPKEWAQLIQQQVYNLCKMSSNL